MPLLLNQGVALSCKAYHSHHCYDRIASLYRWDGRTLSTVQRPNSTEVFIINGHMVLQ